MSVTKPKSTQLIAKGLEALQKVVKGDSDDPSRMFMEAQQRWEQLQQRNRQIQQQLDEIRASTRNNIRSKQSSEKESPL